MIAIPYQIWSWSVSIFFWETTSRVTYMDKSCHMYKWVMVHVWMSHVTCMNESCHVYECVMSHVWVSHVTYEWVMSNIFACSTECYVCVCVSVCIYKRGHMCMCMCVYVLCVKTRSDVYVCVYTCVYGCVHMCEACGESKWAIERCVCICACVCVREIDRATTPLSDKEKECGHTQTHSHTRTHTHTHTRAHTHTHTPSIPCVRRNIGGNARLVDTNASEVLGAHTLSSTTATTATADLDICVETSRIQQQYSEENNHVLGIFNHTYTRTHMLGICAHEPKMYLFSSLSRSHTRAHTFTLRKNSHTIWTHTHAQMHINRYTHISTHTHTCARVGLWVCARVRVSYTHSHTHTHKHTRMHTLVPTLVFLHTHTCTKLLISLSRSLIHTHTLSVSLSHTLEACTFGKLLHSSSEHGPRSLQANICTTTVFQFTQVLPLFVKSQRKQHHTCRRTKNTVCIWKHTHIKIAHAYINLHTYIRTHTHSHVHIHTHLCLFPSVAWNNGREIWKLCDAKLVRGPVLQTPVPWDR